MSGKQAGLVSVDLAARAMVATVRSVVRETLEDILQMQACVSTASAESHAYAALDDMLITRLPALVEAHDALAAALNAAEPEAPAILSLVTDQPAQSPSAT
jgi:hypothetical protein